MRLPLLLGASALSPNDCSVAFPPRSCQKCPSFNQSMSNLMRNLVVSLGVVLPLFSLRAGALQVLATEAEGTWGLTETFEVGSLYGSSGQAGVSYLPNTVDILGGFATLSLISPGEAFVRYGVQPPGAASGAGVPTSTDDYPGFVVSGAFVGTAHGSAQGLGVNAAGATLKIQFDDLVDAFGFYGAGDSMFTVTFFDGNGAKIDTEHDIFCDITLAGNALEFWGWSSPVGIGSVEIFGNHLALDNVMVGGDIFAVSPPPPPPVPVPEATTVVPLAGALLVGSELLRRRVRRA